MRNHTAPTTIVPRGHKINPEQAGDFHAHHAGESAGKILYLLGEFFVHAASGFVDSGENEFLQISWSLPWKTSDLDAHVGELLLAVHLRHGFFMPPPAEASTTISPILLLELFLHLPRNCDNICCNNALTSMFMPSPGRFHCTEICPPNF